MTIPYIIAERNQNKVECNADVVVLHKETPVMVSLLGYSISVKKVFSDLIQSKSSITVRDREDIFYEKQLRTYDVSFRYKLTKHNEKLTHGIIYNTKSDKYMFDWNGDGLVKTLTKFLSSKHFMPVTEDIVQKVLDQQNEYIQMVEQCDVLSSNESVNLSVWYVSVNMFKELLRKVEFASEDTFKWDKIENTTDYLVKFIDPIMEKLQDKIEVLYDENKVNPMMFEHMKPYDGQVPIIQSGVQVLQQKKNRFLYLAAEQGSGKSFMSSKINHLYHMEKNKKSYCTLLIAPAITITQWKDELYNAIGKDIDVHIIKKTDEFIRLYNKTKLKFERPTYILVGKETFKLSYGVKHGVIPKRRKITVKQINERWDWTEHVEKEIEVCLCPDCGVPQKNELRKTEDVYFTEKDFAKAKKSNYKCCNCGTVLFQADYNKTKKTSLASFILSKRDISLDSIIIDEIHESSNFSSLIGSTTRNIIRKGKKIILLSGTVSNGYASSMYNILSALMPNKLKKMNVFDKDKFVNTYGTLMGKTNIKDSDYHKLGRIQVKDSQMQEIEGINPILFSQFMLEGFVSLDLSELANLPNLKEEHIAIEHDRDVLNGEKRMIDDFKKLNALNASFYNDTVIKHYTNNPFKWNRIPITFQEGSDKMDGYVEPINISERLLPKEKKLVEICKAEQALGRKTWVYVDFTTTGKYAEGMTMPTRLKNILEAEGLKVFVLQSDVSTLTRRDVIQKNSDKYDVFISNPRLISVGVNLQFCPNYIFYSPSYHVNIVKQSSRRGMRINSTLENRVIHLYLKNSIEESIMERFKLKLAESNAIQNRFDQVDVKRTASSLGDKINKELNEVL